MVDRRFGAGDLQGRERRPRTSQTTQALFISRRVFKAAALVSQPYLEAQDDIDAYLSKLRTALEKVIADGDPIEIW